MTDAKRLQFGRLIRGIGVRQIRLFCGLTMFAYLTSHFLNHALGNISAEALNSGVYYHTVFWQFLPIAVLLYTAIFVHMGLGLWALYERRQFRWKAIEPLQLVLGLSVPALVIAHVVGVRVGQTLYGQEKLYPQVFYAYWVYWPYKKWLMFLVLNVAWIHGCIGIYFWLRMKRFFASSAPYLLTSRTTQAWPDRCPNSGLITFHSTTSPPCPQSLRLSPKPKPLQQRTNIFMPTR